MIAEGETSEVFRIMGEGGEGVEMVVESCKLDYCVRRGRELIGWDPAKLAYEVAPGRIRAKGMAIAMQGSGIPLIDMGSANLELQDGGFFKLHIGATDLGTGSDTILAQIAAEELGVGSDDIIVYASDTDHTPYDVGAYASSTTYVSGNAVIEAAQRMKLALREAVADKFELRPDEVEFDGKMFTAADGKEACRAEGVQRRYPLPQRGENEDDCNVWLLHRGEITAALHGGIRGDRDRRRNRQD